MATAPPPARRPAGLLGSLPPLVLPLMLLPVAVGIFTHIMQEIVPNPYLDEVFHIPQAQKYCAGRFNEWDSKITTPFGLYGLAYIMSLVLGTILPAKTPEALCSPLALRMINTMGVELVLPVVVYKLHRALHPRAGGWKAAEVATVVATFPLLFFFAGLFYTDVWSTIFVLLGYLNTVNGNIWVAAGFSAISCLFRQTNILWTAFFLVDHLVRFTEAKAEASDLIDVSSKGKNEPWKDVLSSSWDNGFLFNPALSRNQLYALPKSVVSLALSLLHRPTEAILHALPYVSVLGGFIAFIFWNGSIACGDKDAHPFTIHIPQLFYFTTFFLFSSWPLFLSLHYLRSFLSSTFPLLSYIFQLPSSLIPLKFDQPKTPLKAAIRRTLISLAVLASMVAIIKANTYYHPYLLADNRNFRFYLFRRTLLRYSWAKYAAILVYFPAGWLLYKSLEHKSVLWVCAYTVAVAGGLVGAGLVEFRYFVLGWVVWRLNLSTRTDGNRARRWAEIGWFLALDFWSAYVFFNWGFKWEQYEDLQRFMW